MTHAHIAHSYSVLLLDCPTIDEGLIFRHCYFFLLSLLFIFFITYPWSSINRTNFATWWEVSQICRHTSKICVSFPQKHWEKSYRTFLEGLLTASQLNCNVATCLRWGGQCGTNFVGNFMHFQQCKNFENQLRPHKVTESLKVGTFFETQCRV